LKELEKKGWCWGGSQYGYLEHWLECADDPHYRPAGSIPSFSEADIQERADLQNKQ
jgi:hypothetical protein